MGYKNFESWLVDYKDVLVEMFLQNNQLTEKFYEYAREMYKRTESGE